MRNNRRSTFSWLGITILAALLLALWGGQVSGQGEATAAATLQGTQEPIVLPQPACAAPAQVSAALTEGPYYKKGSPERSSLIGPDIKGDTIIVTGYVLGTDCKPVAHAWLDFWQADGEGTYDNTGYNLRGYQYTDDQGRYVLETVLPGEYPGRTEHIHVKVQAPNGPILTTQIFFPGVADNSRDSIFDPSLVVSVLNPTTGEVVTETPTPAATAAADGEIPVVYTINFVVALK